MWLQLTTHFQVINPSSRNARNMNCRIFTAKNNSIYKTNSVHQPVFIVCFHFLLQFHVHYIALSAIHVVLHGRYLICSLVPQRPHTNANWYNWQKKYWYKDKDPQNHLAVIFQLIAHKHFKHQQQQVNASAYNHGLVRHVWITFHPVNKLIYLKIRNLNLFA